MVIARDTAFSLHTSSSRDGCEPCSARLGSAPEQGWAWLTFYYWSYADSTTELVPFSFCQLPTSN